MTTTPSLQTPVDRAIEELRQQFSGHEIEVTREPSGETVVSVQNVHVGDHYYADYVGASAVGMKAVLIERIAGTCPAPKATTISTLDDLETALAR